MAIVIIGGGITGLAAAHYLSQKGVDGIQVYDKGGPDDFGRFISASPPDGIKGDIMEKGPMRFSDNSELLKSLLEHLRHNGYQNELTERPFFHEAPAPREIIKANGNPEERDLEAEKKVYREVCKNFLDLNLKTFQNLPEDKFNRFAKTSRLAKMKLEEIVGKKEIDVTGYPSWGKWNALYALRYEASEATKEKDHKTLVHGMQSLPRALRQSLIKRIGTAAFHDNHTLETIIQKENGKFILTFKGHPEVQADKVILAITHSALGILRDNNDLLQTDGTERTLDNVSIYQARKIFFYYKNDDNGNPWWQKHTGYRCAKYITDNWLKQVFLFGSSKEQDHSLLLSYGTHEEDFDHWTNLQGRASKGEASSKVVKAVRRGLAKTLGIDASEIPDPAAAYFVGWNKAYGLVKPGNRILVEPIQLTSGIFFAGTHVGWIEENLKKAKTVSEQC